VGTDHALTKANLKKLQLTNLLFQTKAKSMVSNFHASEMFYLPVGCFNQVLDLVASLKVSNFMSRQFFVRS
jgi:hypothetical protein